MAMEEFVAVRLAGRSVGGRPIAPPWPLLGGRWLLDCQVGQVSVLAPVQRELLVVGQTLEAVWQLRLPEEPAEQTWRGSHAVSDDLSLVALSLPREVRLLDRNEELLARFPYPDERESRFALFTSDSQLLVGVPHRDEAVLVNAGDDAIQRLPRVPDREAGGCAFTADGRYLWVCVGEELWLIELASQRVLDRRALQFPRSR